LVDHGDRVEAQFDNGTTSVIEQAAEPDAPAPVVNAQARH
jgi:hypothetical protein